MTLEYLVRIADHARALYKTLMELFEDHATLALLLGRKVVAERQAPTSMGNIEAGRGTKSKEAGKSVVVCL